MRSDASQYQLLAPTSLEEFLALLANEPGQHTPIAGGTELMVALNTGRLVSPSLLSLHKLQELRFIDDGPDRITIGSGTTFTDLRHNPAIAEHLPLLAQSASWTGSIANQNRGTIGGNIVNASPAADSPPALLVYEAELVIVSTSGKRTLPYTDFHLGYKRTALRKDELLHSVILKKCFGGYRSYIRKVGTRKAQAISKVALAALARTAYESGTVVVTDIRIAAASLADRPIRCLAAEQSLLRQPVTVATIAAARSALIAETRAIDDIRSTGKYRAAVAANLLHEFLGSLLRVANH